MKNRQMMQAILSLSVVLILIVPIFPSSFAYSTSVTSDSSANIVVNEIDIYDADGAENYDGIVNSKIYYRSSSNTYSFINGTVSNGLSLMIRGSGNYVLGVMATGCSAVLTSIIFKFGSDVELTVPITNGSGSAYVNSRVYAAGSSVPFSATITAGTGDSTELSLGDVKFVMVPLGSSTTVPSDLVLTGATTNVGENVVTTELKEVIENTTDVKEAIEEVNNGSNEITGTVGNTEEKYYVRETEDIKDSSGTAHPAVVITTQKEDSNTNIAPNSQSFDVNVPVPANVYCLVAVTITGTVLTENYMTVSINGYSLKVTGTTWIERTYYLYISNGKLTSSTTIPDVSKWINSGTNGLDIQVNGNKNFSEDMALKLRVMMESINSSN